MTDHPRFQQSNGDFERSYHHYYGAPLGSFVSRASASVMNYRAPRMKQNATAIQASLVSTLLGVHSYSVYTGTQSGIKMQ